MLTWPLQPCVADCGEQGPQSLAQELPRGVSGPSFTVSLCGAGWGQSQASVQVQQEQEALGPWASIPHMLWEGAENWRGWG